MKPLLGSRACPWLRVAARTSRLTSFKSTRFDSPANGVRPWPASLGCTTSSYSSINPSSVNASESVGPPTNSPFYGSTHRPGRGAPGGSNAKRRLHLPKESSHAHPPHPRGRPWHPLKRVTSLRPIVRFPALPGSCRLGRRPPEAAGAGTRLISDVASPVWSSTTRLQRAHRHVVSVRISEGELTGLGVLVDMRLLVQPWNEPASPSQCRVEIVGPCHRWHLRDLHGRAESDSGVSGPLPVTHPINSPTDAPASPSASRCSCSPTESTSTSSASV